MAKSEPLLMHLYRTSGFGDGTKAAAFIVAWGIYSDDPKSEKPPTPEGYRNYWKCSEASFYRELRAFRHSFADDRYPDRVWAMLRAHIESRKVASATKEAMFVAGRWV